MPLAWLDGHLPNGFEHSPAGIRFLEISSTTQGRGGISRAGIVMSSDEDDGRPPACDRKLPSEFYAGHVSQLNIKNKAAELGMLTVCEKGFGRTISNGLKARRTQ